LYLFNGQTFCDLATLTFNILMYCSNEMALEASFYRADEADKFSSYSEFLN